MTTSRIVIASLVVGGLGLLIACGGGTGNAPTGGPSANASRNTPDKIDAWVMAEKFLKENYLRSPGTADFGGVFGGDYQDPNQCVTVLGGGEYLVKGWVDAQNAFGATVRNHFSMTIKHDGDRTWTLVGTPAISENRGDVEAASVVDAAAAKVRAEEQQAREEEERKRAARQKRQAERRERIEKAKWRTWTSAGGNFTVEAKFVSRLADQVKLEKADGQTITVAFDKLSDGDREWIARSGWLDVEAPNDGT